jgi:HSP20 family protein
MLKEMHSRKVFQSQLSQAWHPRVNLYETESCFFVCAELAGVRREEIEVHLTDGVLQFRGARAKPRLPECPVGDPDRCHVSVHVMEIDSGEFERSVTLPTDVQVEQISAVYRDGYLWIILPRSSVQST